MLQSLKGDLAPEQEQELLIALRGREEALGAVRAANEERAREVAALEATFARVRQATGVHSLEDMVAKIANQAANRETLEREEREVERRAAAVRHRQEELEQRFCDMKASGVGSTELNRDISDKLKAEAESYRAEVKATKIAYEKLEETLLAVRQGAKGLCQRLSVHFGLLEEEDAALLQRAQGAGGAQAEMGGCESEAETALALSVSETVLSKMLEVASAGNTGDTARTAGGEADEDGSDFDNASARAGRGGALDSGGGGASPLLADADAAMHNNVRVVSGAARSRGEGGDAAGDDDDGAEDACDAAGGGGGGGGGGGSGGSGGGGGGGGDAEDGGAYEGDRADDMVPSRAFLKLCSSRQCAEVMRRQEAGERKAVMAAKLEGADESEKAALTSKLARKRQQERAMERIALPPPAVGLPDGVTQRDDVYVKTTAFLTQPLELE
ncbi:hypothetical protein JKP88DRAFT_321768 [Tribonema minus]|uniref:Uncharacterized protein n=1 Tax=Tribonema minus TaxID=303371 RepID=A0A836CDP6_9STRA|nr:hypothetical protein JKP88DRAFT_321768 [Tribonema minus]